MALINRFPLTTDGNDVVGGLVATNNGGITFSPTSGANFNGTTQWLSYIVSRSSGAFSMSVWVKPSNFTTSSFQGIFSSASVSAGNARGISTYLGMTYVYTGGGNSGHTANTEWTITNFPSSIFTLMVVTYDGTTAKIYRNNINTFTGTVVDGVIDSNLSIGRFGSGSSYFYSGNCLDARYYSHVFTTAEITTLVLAGPNGDTSIIQRPQAIGSF